MWEVWGDLYQRSHSTDKMHLEEFIPCLDQALRKAHWKMMAIQGIRPQERSCFKKAVYQRKSLSSGLVIMLSRISGADLRSVALPIFG